MVDDRPDLRDALPIFERHALLRLPLVADDRVVGMLTMDDLVVDLTGGLARPTRPITAQVLFGHRQPVAPATTTRGSIRRWAVVPAISVTPQPAGRSVVSTWANTRAPAASVSCSTQF